LPASGGFTVRLMKDRFDSKPDAEFLQFCSTPGANAHKSGANFRSPKKYEENRKAINREPDNLSYKKIMGYARQFR